MTKCTETLSRRISAGRVTAGFIFRSGVAQGIFFAVIGLMMLFGTIFSKIEYPHSVTLAVLNCLAIVYSTAASFINIYAAKTNFVKFGPATFLRLAGVPSKTIRQLSKHDSALMERVGKHWRRLPHNNYLGYSGVSSTMCFKDSAIENRYRITTLMQSTHKPAVALLVTVGFSDDDILASDPDALMAMWENDVPRASAATAIENGIDPELMKSFIDGSGLVTLEHVSA
jgi:hypothetical protein